MYVLMILGDLCQGKNKANSFVLRTAYCVLRIARMNLKKQTQFQIG
jgi:hypothetical protein